MSRTLSLRLLAAILLTFGVHAADWTTFGGDPQRTGWVREETDLTKANVAKLKLDWSLKLENEGWEGDYDVPEELEPSFADPAVV